MNKRFDKKYLRRKNCPKKDLWAFLNSLFLS